MILNTRKRLPTLLIMGAVFIFLMLSCSTKKNTLVSRTYHSVNTRYNIHFNAQLAYDEALYAKEQIGEESLSELLYIYPDNSDSTNIKKGNFTTTIDKTTKAIKSHSIKTRPKRDRAKMKDPNYLAWLQQKEFNPFLHNTWMLLAKSEFQEANYLRAITTFMYITKIYSANKEIVAECTLWVARAYTEMGWMYEAENVLRKMEQNKLVPPAMQYLYAMVKANYLIHNEEYAQAIPYLQTAIGKQKGGLQKIRMRYLLGQLYTKIGDKENAFQAFKSVKGMSTPHKYAFNADLHQIELSNNTIEETIKRFDKLAKSAKNEEYKDKIYYLAANRYMQQPDTTQAIKYYTKAISESKNNGYDKTMAAIDLGDIYYIQQNFIAAQPNYASAVNELKKRHKDYKRIHHRSSVLDDLVVHAKIVHLQDSLQHLASLPQAEQLTIIEQKIEAIKKAEKEAKKTQELEEALGRQTQGVSSWGDLEQLQQTTAPTISQIGQKPTVLFYFYNPQTVEQGRVAFQKKWGSRKLEDDWRRKEKSISLFGDLHETMQAEKPTEDDKDEADKETTELAETNEQETDEAGSTDIYSVEYYLQQLPLTEDAKKASDELIENALFQMGHIYRERLENTTLAIDAFSSCLHRSPKGPNVEAIYYQLFLIYMQLNNQELMLAYRNKIIEEFPDGAYAIPLSEPNYEWNFRHMASMQNELYENTYNAYRLADVNTVRENVADITRKYPFGDLMPKFSFLNALSYAQTKQVDSLATNLKQVIDKYPKSDVVPLATDILQRIVDGQIILSDGTLIQNIDWNKAYETEEIADSTFMLFSDSLHIDYQLQLSYTTNSIDRNELLYQVADYNFSNYLVQVHDLNIETSGQLETLYIKGFKDFSAIRNYINKGFKEDGLFRHLHLDISILPIASQNVKVLPKLGLDAYKRYFEEHFGEEVPALIHYWKTYQIIKDDDNDHNDDNEETTEEEPKEIKKETQAVEADKDIEDDLQGKIVVKPGEKLKPKPTDEKIDKKDDEDKQEINLEDVLTKDQVEVAGKANEVLESAEELLSNPVEGIKSVMNIFKKTDKLSKEEKQELKVEREKIKKQQKEIEAQAKAKTDAIQRTEQAVQDSIKQVENNLLEQKQAERKALSDAAKALEKAREDARKDRENERKTKIKEQNEKRNEQENRRKELIKQRDSERKIKMKEQDERRKQLQKEQEEKRKEQQNRRKQQK